MARGREGLVAIGLAAALVWAMPDWVAATLIRR